MLLSTKYVKKFLFVPKMVDSVLNQILGVNADMMQQLMNLCVHMDVVRIIAICTLC